MELQYLSHSSFKVAFNGTNVLIDPFFNHGSKDPGFKRLVTCPLKKEEIKDIDMILVTHEHFDHFDKKAIEYFASRDNSLVVGYESFLRELKLPESQLRPITIRHKTVYKKINIEVVEAHHPHSFYPVGYILEHNSNRLFHAGDTDLLDSFNEIKADVALLPIGGNMTMDTIDAVRATKIIKPKVAIPMHYNTFSMIQADPREFKERIEKSIIKTKPIIMTPGQKVKV